MEDKFILVRKPKTGKQNDNRPLIRISAEAYETLARWASLTGKSITDVATRAVEFAAAHAEIVDE